MRIGRYLLLIVVSLLVGFVPGWLIGYQRGESDTTLMRSTLETIRALSLIEKINERELAPAKRNLEMEVDEHILVLGSAWAQSRENAHVQKALYRLVEYRRETLFENPAGAEVTETIRAIVDRESKTIGK